MSVEAISWALNLAPVPPGRGGQLSSACKFVLVGLANHTGPEGTGAFPSVATLVRDPARLTASLEEYVGHPAYSIQREALNAARRRLPMTEIGKQYLFEGRDGKASLLELFEGRGQLLIYHFMFDPDWDEGCPTCSFLTDNIGHLSHLHARDTTLALVSRAPLAKIEPFRQRMGWTIPWYSSFGSDFNYDFHVTLDQDITPVEYNYRGLAELGPEWQGWSGEMFGVSAFLRHRDRVYHTYSSYARSCDMLDGIYHWLDLTARGQQEDWEQPPGRSDGPALGWLRHHDRYDT